MAGRILLNTSGAPFRVRPQQRKRFDDMYDTGSMDGAEYMAQAGKGIDLAMKVYGMADKAATFTRGGRTVNPDAASLAADQGADAVVAAQQAQMAPQQAQVPAQAPVAYNPETHQPYNAPQESLQQNYLTAVDAVNNAQTLEQLQTAQTALRSAETSMYRSPTGENPYGPSGNEAVDFRRAKNRLQGQQEDLPYEKKFLDYYARQGQAPTRQPQIDRTMSSPFIGRQTNNPQNLQIQTQQQAQMQAMQQLQQQDAMMQAMQQAEAAVPNALPEFKSIVEAEAALAKAKAAGDIAGWNTAVKAMQNSPLTDVRPQSLQDAVFGTHVTRAQQALIKKHPPPKGLTEFEKWKVENLKSQMGKRDADIAKGKHELLLKDLKEVREGEKFGLFKTKHAAELKKLGIDTGISFTELMYRKPKLLAAIQASKATSAQKYASAAELRRGTKLKKKMAPFIEKKMVDEAYKPEDDAINKENARIHAQKLQDERLAAAAGRSRTATRDSARETAIVNLEGEKVTLETLLRNTADYKAWKDGATPDTVRKQLEDKNKNIARLAGVEKKLDMRRAQQGSPEPTTIKATRTPGATKTKTASGYVSKSDPVK